MQRGSCCEVCGILAHESCARHVPDDCRPIALPAEKVLHTWKAAGTVVIEEQVCLATPLTLCTSCSFSSKSRVILMRSICKDAVLVFTRRTLLRKLVKCCIWNSLPLMHKLSACFDLSH